MCHASAIAQREPAVSPAISRKPNIVVIVMDDMGFSDFSSFGGEIRTPSIDTLAAAGVRYNHFDTKAICSATRASLLTGRNNGTVGMQDLPSTDPSQESPIRYGHLSDRAETIAGVLRDDGYRTIGIGKWHLAPFYETGAPGNNESWPLQRGFDYFYGFIRGWTDQYHPSLVEGNKPIPTPRKPGYHLSVDLVDQAIAEMQRSSTSHPKQPLFLYLAFGAAHSPLQVPKSYADAYAGIYDKGWDAIRADRFARQKAMGVVPADAILPPDNPGDRKWADLSPSERRVYARFMEVYAGYITHADEQIGRLLAYMKGSGLYPNTIFVVLSDNGANGQAGQTGSLQTHSAEHPTSAKVSPEEMLKRIDELGTDTVQPEYQRPWAMAGDTPFRRYKAWPYLGGIRTPLVIAWPGVISTGGTISTQYLDVIDLAPTLAKVAHTAFPSEIDGKPEIPLAGHSITATLDGLAARGGRKTQVFLLCGNRAITSDGWRAVAMHKPGTAFSSDRWQLFNVAHDYTESHDLSVAMPEKLAAMKSLWWEQAKNYKLLPLRESLPRMTSEYADAFFDRD